MGPAGPVPAGSLKLRAATPAAWLRTCQDNLHALLSDHAHCERKAAASALSLVSRLPGDGALVRAMAALAREESHHLLRVHEALRSRGWDLHNDSKDDYVLGLRRFVDRGTTAQHVDELLLCALIEARSAERLQILAQGLADADLRALYGDLALSEDGHAALFVERARAYAPQRDVAQRLGAWLDHEASLVTALPVAPRVHG
jgi:tRNA-(ms[2]io[6]A)-hydroxylase